MENSDIVIELYKSKNPIKILESFKLLNYEKSSEKIRQSISFPLAKRILFHDSSLPKNYSELRKVKQLRNLNNLEGELAWFVNSLSNFINEINLFIQKEKEFQKSILLNEYENSKLILDDINNNICFSYWSIENSFSVEQRLKNTEGNWNLLKKINKESNLPYTLFFNNYFSRKSEIDISIFQYKKELENIINSNISSDDIEYIIFKLGHFYYKKFNEYAYLIYCENLSSIIDKYIFLLEILNELSNDFEYKNLVSKVLNDLEKFGIKDCRILRLKEFNKEDKLYGLNKEIINLFNIYSIGKYDETIDFCKKLLVKYPFSIEIYETYIKSLLEKGDNFIKTNISQNIDTILGHLFSLFNRENSFNESREFLIKEYLSFPKLSFFKQLLSLTLGISSNEVNKSINSLYFNFSSHSNPQLLIEKRKTFKSAITNEELNKNISLRINHFIAKGKNKNILSENSIPKHKLKIYEARIGFYYISKLNIDLLEKTYMNEKISNYFLEEIIVFLFDGYIKTNKTVKLINLISNVYFSNRFLLERLDKAAIINYIIQKNYLIDEINIDLPILFYIENTDSYYLYVTLELYLETIFVSKPSEIEEMQNIDKLIFLLYNICTVDVLNNFYLIYENDDEVIDERIKILKNLARFDKSNQKIYFEEIAYQTQKQRINKTLKVVNDGKISLNFSRIREDNKFGLENNFNRFLKLAGYANKNEFKLIDSSLLLQSYLSELNSENDKLQEASFLTFKSLFFEVVDHFLFSKEHGLEGDLSTRIRHGVLENQLRSIFKPLNLISTKGIDNEYNDIVFWNNLCEEKSYKKEVYQSLQSAFKRFSESIDELIQTIIREYLQIQSNNHFKKNLGLFNYRFTDEYIWIFYKEITSTIDNYEDFISYTFEILTIITNSSLKTVKNFIEQDVNNLFLDLINELENQVKSIINKGEIWSEINHNINISRTQIEKELFNISNWFKITNDLNIGSLDMDTIIHTAFESFNLYNSDLDKITPKINVPENNFFAKGFYYIDIFKILISNSIQHSKADLKDLNISISVNNKVLYNNETNQEEPFSMIEILFENNISQLVDLNLAIEKLSHVKKNWNNDLSRVNVEKGSGFQKIKRILDYDLKVYESTFDFTTNENRVEIVLKFINKFNIINE